MKEAATSVQGTLGRTGGCFTMLTPNISPGVLRRVSSTIITLSPVVQRQNGPSSEDADAQRRMMEQHQMQAHKERERRTSGSVVSTLQYKVSSNPVHPDTPPEYRQFRACTLPPSYVRVASASPPSASSSSPSQEREGGGSARERAQLSSQLSTSLASAFSPVQTGLNTQGRQVRQIPLSPPTAARQQHQEAVLPPKHGTWSASHMHHYMYGQAPPSASPPVMMAVHVKQGLPPQPVLPVALPLPPLSARAPKPLPPEPSAATAPHQHPHPHQHQHPHHQPPPHANGQVEDYYSPHSQHLPMTPQYCEPVPLPPLTGQTQAPGPASGHPQYSSSFHTQQQQQQQQQQVYQQPPSSSSYSPPSYTAMSDGGTLRKTPSPPVPLQGPPAGPTCPPVSAGHPSSLLSVAPPPAPAPALAPCMAGPPAPPPPPGPPPPMAVPPPMPPPLPACGGPPGGAPGLQQQPSGLAAAIAGAKLRRVQRDESSPPGSSGSNKSDSNRSSGGSGGGGDGQGLMQEMNALLARRRKASEKPDEDDSSGRQNSTDAVKKPWERSNSAEKSSLVSRSVNGVRPIGSTSDADTEFDRMKQEILDEVVRELHKVKDEIINAIRQEIGRISTS